MKISLTQISISDRVNAAKSDTRPSNTDTSAVPTSINPSPGDSTIAPPDLGAINSAGQDVNQQSKSGNQATTEGARKTQSQQASSIQYDRQLVNPEEQAPSAANKEELANTPPPKSKGFKESLIDSQMSSMIGDRTGGDHPAPDRDYGHNTPEPEIGAQPESQPVRRDKMAPYNNQNNKVPEPKTFPISSWDRENNMEPYKAPDQDLGPVYKPKTINQPKAPGSTIKFNAPRINLPRFN